MHGVILRWVGILALLASSLPSFVVAAEPKHGDDSPGTNTSPGHIRPRTDNSRMDYVPAGEFAPNDPVVTELMQRLAEAGLIASVTTGEKKKSPADQRLENQNRPGYSEPFPTKAD